MFFPLRPPGLVPRGRLSKRPVPSSSFAGADGFQNVLDPSEKSDGEGKEKEAIMEYFERKKRSTKGRIGKRRRSNNANNHSNNSNTSDTSNNNDSNNDAEQFEILQQGEKYSKSNPHNAIKSKAQGTAGSYGYGRIAGGVYRNRAIPSPAGVFIRPAMKKVKEGLFSTLTSLGLFHKSIGGVRHLDLFAGTGAMGLEVLSRCEMFEIPHDITFCDLSELCTSTITSTLRSMSVLTDTTVTVQCSALDLLRDPASHGLQVDGKAFDLITITPPYLEVSYDDIFQAVSTSPLLRSPTLVVMEYPRELSKKIPVQFQAEGGRMMRGVRNRRYGRTGVAIYATDGGDYTFRPQEFLPPPRQQNL